MIIFHFGMTIPYLRLLLNVILILIYFTKILLFNTRSANQITRTSEKIRTVEIDTNDSSEACPKICTKDEDKKLELKAAEDGKCEGDICEYVNDMVDGQAAAPRCQSVAFIDDQRKLSNGILKAPSRCSSADVVTGNGKEKRKLRVTFEDEVFHKLQKQIAIKV